MRYEEYKQTKLFWLPEIPQNWEWRFLSQAATEQQIKKPVGKMFPVLTLTYGEVKKKKNIDEGLVPETYDNYQMLYTDNIVMRLIDLQNDHTSLRTGLVKETGIITSAYTCLMPSENAKYLRYLLHSYDTKKVFYGFGGGVRQSIGFKDIRHLMIPVPPRAEQDQIVRYLDWQVSKINKLIAAKKKGITLLLEYRKQLVTNELCGEQVKLKRTLRAALQYGANDSGVEFSNSEPRYIRITDITLDGRLKETGRKSIVRQNAIPFILEDGDVLLARSGATVGKAFIYKQEYGESAFAGYLIRAQFDKTRLLPEYFMCFTDSSIYEFWKSRVFIQATIQNISAERYAYLSIPTPTVEKQKCIIDKLSIMCGNIDALKEKYINQINMLHELRTRIISDVVTGQIDVRNIEVPNFEIVEETDDSDDEADVSEETEEQEE